MENPFAEWNSGDPISALFGKYGLFSNPTGAWDRFKNGNTNQVNLDIANENLSYQKERNKIEDARYEEETAYNRAFAEDERAYNRALQQQLFEREDTAQIRQAEQLSALGINPLSQQLNGAGAGQVVGSATAPTDSVRGGTTLHNDFKMQDMGVMQALAPLASLANTINQVATGQGQRDLLQSQVDKQQLENYITARKHGIFGYNLKGFNTFSSQNPAGVGSHWWDSESTNQFNKSNNESLDWQNKLREYNYKNNNNIFDSQPEWAKNMNYLMSDSFYETAEKALTKGSQLFDKAFDNTDLDTKKLNPFTKFLNLFF